MDLPARRSRHRIGRDDQHWACLLCDRSRDRVRPRRVLGSPGLESHPGQHHHDHPAVRSKATSTWAPTQAPEVSRWDALTGATIWSTGGFSLIDASAAVYDGINIYLATSWPSTWPSTQPTVTSSGAPASQEPVGTAPAYANGFLYGTSWFGALYTFDTSNGSIVDQEPLLSRQRFRRIPRDLRWLGLARDNDGNIYGFFGQLPVGLTLKPSAQGQDSVPDNTVSYTVTVKKRRDLGPGHLRRDDHVGRPRMGRRLVRSRWHDPLPDTNGNSISGHGFACDRRLRQRHSQGDGAGHGKPRRLRAFEGDLHLEQRPQPVQSREAHHDRAGARRQHRPRAYFALQPGNTATAPMDARNKGGFPDTIELAATSSHGWT